MTRQKHVFNPTTFLSTVGTGREMISFQKGQTIVAQGNPTESIFVIQTGSVKLSARSQNGKEATLDILGPEDFVGCDSIAGQPLHIASASALTECVLLRIESSAMLLALAKEPTLSNMFCTYVLTRNVRYQQDLLDQRCNPSEKRLARILLLVSHFFGQSSAETVVARINHEILAEMVGTTRSRVCFFMKKFKDAGFIDYDLKEQPLRVRRSLLAFYAR